MKKSMVVALSALVVSLLAPPLSAAGPIGDMLRERAAQRRAPGGQQASPTRDDIDDADDRAGAVAEVPGGVTAERDLAYGPDAAQRLDVYRPAQAIALAPVIFMVHGGGWRHGDKAMGRVVTHKMAHWVKQGTIFVSVNYRLSDADPIEEANDVARALAYAQSRAKSWGGDPARFVLMGHSAGAHLVALLSADPSIAQRHGAGPWAGTVALDSAAYDVVDVMQRRHYRLYDPVFKNDPALWRQASPFHRLTSAPAPMLLVCSTRRAESCPQAKAFAAKARGSGGRVSELSLNLSHSQINDQLGLPGPYTEAVDSFLRSLAAK